MRDNERLQRAISFYNESPDGQYDREVVGWLLELIELRSQLAAANAREDELSERLRRIFYLTANPLPNG